MNRENLPPHWQAIADNNDVSTALIGALMAAMMRQKLIARDDLSSLISDQADALEDAPQSVRDRIQDWARALRADQRPTFQVIDGGLSKQPETPPDD
ncbi:hypothetical protein [Brevundimonas sp. TWP2-3-2]|uniref:hypothetical protein n=1 Tax=unclassified Brevundimonas TaxID=2622653 RepID=UPI003CEBAB37